MTLGTILGASFQVMRRNPRTTLVPGLIVAVLLALAVGVGMLAVVSAASRIGSGASADLDALFAGTLAIALLVGMAGIALGTVATALLQAIIVTEVARGTVGEKLTLGQIWTVSKSRFGAVIGYTALLVLVIVVGFVLFYAIFFGLIFAVTAGLGTGQGAVPDASAIGGLIVVTLGVFLIGGGGALALMLWLSTKLAFVAAAIVLERLPIRKAIARSWRLSRGRFWRTLGILLLVQVMINVATQIVTTPLSFIAGFGGSLLDPTGAGFGDGQAIVLIVAMYAVIAGVSAIGLVILAATTSLMYLDLRMRTEGLDLELSRYVEARQAGAQVPDPYLPRA
jgi:membrane-anchored glycerophosphoryl diester phosphodiesterase (GDPDase)